MAKKKKTKKKATRKKASGLKPSSINEKALGYRCRHATTNELTCERQSLEAAMQDQKIHEGIECTAYVIQERTLAGWHDFKA